LIIATAGHVDHGKTSLIKGLTGVDTDRTEEEQRRGLSINLGYAYRSVDANTRIGFIDVPGHRRFINTMIAGVSGIDLGMVVVAADDGPMPQTLEHLDILRLLGVQRYLLVVTKSDRVELDRCDQVVAQMQNLLPVDSPVFIVSNTSGEGLAALQAALDSLATQWAARDIGGRFRMSLDRSFHLKGVGLVVTGTVTSGVVNEQDELLVQPQGVSVRVRGIHAQDEKTLRAQPGDRCALNITGNIELKQLSRGDCLVDPDVVGNTSRFDARLHLLDSLPFALKHLSPVKLHIGARRIDARVFLLQGGTTLAAGEEALVQIMLERKGELVCCRGDRFVLQDYGETNLLGGGVVLDPAAPREGKSRPARLDWLAAQELDSPTAAAASILFDSGQLLNASALCRDWNLSAEQQEQMLGDAAFKHSRSFTEQSSAGITSTWLVAEEPWQQQREQLLASLRDWHGQHPEEQGIKPALLRKRVSVLMADVVVAPLLMELLKDKQLVMDGGLLRLVDHKVSLSGAEQQLWQRLRELLLAASPDIPRLPLLVESSGCPADELLPVLKRAVGQGRMHRLNENRYCLPETLLEMTALVQRLNEQQGEISVRQFRDAVGCGRGLAIEVLEYFDTVRYTQRRGEARIVLDEALPQRLFSG
jgi:selenocysteine-specific elongation factor